MIELVKRTNTLAATMPTSAKTRMRNDLGKAVAPFDK